MDATARIVAQLCASIRGDAQFSCVFLI